MNGSPPRLRAHRWALLGLSVIALAAYAVVRRGNIFGVDEWMNIYTVLDRGLAGGLTNRPLNRLAQTVIFRTAGIGPGATYAAYLLIRLATAFTLYLLIREAAGDPVFGFACGAVYLTYTVNDFETLLFILRISKASALLAGLLALLAFARARSRQAVWLIPALALAAFAVLAFEGVVPVLAAAPVLLSLARGRAGLRRRDVLLLAAWEAALALAAARYALPLLGIGAYTYGAGTLAGRLDAMYLVNGSVEQMKNAFAGLLLIEPAALAAHRLPALVTAAAVLLALAAVRPPLDADATDSGGAPRYALWLAAGLALTWLGFAPYLPTVYIQQVFRIHVVAAVGEAIALAAGIWLLAALARDGRARRAIQTLGMMLTAAAGAATVAAIQAEINGLGATWDTQAIFLRSLAHQVPALREDALFVYVEDPALPEVPFISGWSFDFAMRYLYDDRAAGLVPTDTLFFQDWAIDDAGIAITAQARAGDHPLVHEAFYGWDRVIFVTKRPGGEADILGALPPDYATPARAAAYDPDALIAPAFVSPRVSSVLPPLRRTWP